MLVADIRAVRDILLLTQSSFDFFARGWSQDHARRLCPRQDCLEAMLKSADQLKQRADSKQRIAQGAVRAATCGSLGHLCTPRAIALFLGQTCFVSISLSTPLAAYLATCLLRFAQVSPQRSIRILESSKLDCFAHRVDLCGINRGIEYEALLAMEIATSISQSEKVLEPQT